MSQSAFGADFVKGSRMVFFFYCQWVSFEIDIDVHQLRGKTFALDGPCTCTYYQ